MDRSWSSAAVRRRREVLSFARWGGGSAGAGAICLRAFRSACPARDRLVSPIIEGAPPWLIFWFSVRARALRFRPGSRPNGFCSTACRASRCRCAVRPAARCISGNPVTPGSARSGNPAMAIGCGHPGVARDGLEQRERQAARLRLALRRRDLCRLRHGFRREWDRRRGAFRPVIWHGGSPSRSRHRRPPQDVADGRQPEREYRQKHQGHVASDIARSRSR